MKKNKFSNHLKNEKSPYLLQHANNPVDWYPWTNEAFTIAKRENKPIFLSIGYSTCHWCHVMAYESFEDPTIAKMLNDTFVCIKVDREERPDIDNLYMHICQIITGSGGWPLTIIMNPDKEPFFAGTYFPKNNRYGRIGLQELIPYINDLWNNKKTEIEYLKDQIIKLLKKTSEHKPDEELGIEIMKKTFDDFTKIYDKNYGGFSKAPKFPSPHNMMFLLRYWKRNNDKKALEMVEKTLQEMRKGGIYDHIGYGFHRYSTDDKWILPHFEKMLYDNSLIAVLYIEAFQITKNQIYKDTAKEILEYLSRDMQSVEGGFCSAEDADSEGFEGKFYLWEYNELEKNLTKEEFNVFTNFFNIQKNGNYINEVTQIKNGLNIIYQLNSQIIIDSKTKKILNSVKKKLLKIRKKRIHPYKDDKILTDWNGLAIAAFSKAARVFSESRYLAIAEKTADFILEKMVKPDGSLFHRYRHGDKAISGNINDYAFFINGLIELYQSNFEINYLKKAIKLNKYLIKHFWDIENGGFFFSSDYDEKILIRKKEIYDGAIPSGNSVAMINLLKLSRITGDNSLEEKARLINKYFSNAIKDYPTAFTQFLIGLDFQINPSYEVVISGNFCDNNLKNILNTINMEFIPNIITLHRPNIEKSEIVDIAPFIKEKVTLNNKPTVYICHNYTCEKPLNDISEIMRILGIKKY